MGKGSAPRRDSIGRDAFGDRYEDTFRMPDLDDVQARYLNDACTTCSRTGRTVFHPGDCPRESMPGRSKAESIPPGSMTGSGMLLSSKPGQGIKIKAGDWPEWDSADDMPSADDG